MLTVTINKESLYMENRIESVFTSLVSYIRGTAPDDIVYRDDDSCEVKTKLSMKEVVESVVVGCWASK